MGANYMLKNNICDIMKNEYDSNNKFSICSKLSVVDEAKTDMEYNCFKCANAWKNSIIL